MNNNDQDQNAELVEPSAALEMLERASIDQQIATARRYPRSVKQFLADARDMVTLDVETAEGCFYRLERKDNSAPNGVKVIEGPSVRLLEIAASCYGNIRFGSRVIAVDDKFVIAQGVAHDLQRNVYSSTEVRRRITTKSGHRFGDDMIGVTANAACAVAKRNALNGVVPRVYINQLCDLAMETARGTQKTLMERRARAVGYFVEKLGVKLDRVLAKLERKGVEEITLDDLDRLNGLKTALKENETTLDAEFPAAPKPGAEGPAAGILAAADGTAKTDAPAAPAGDAAAAKKPTAVEELPEWTPEKRDQLVSEMQSAMLDLNVTESRLWTYAKQGKHVPEGVDELWALPSDVLAKLRHAIKAIAPKGGAK